MAPLPGEPAPSVRVETALPLDAGLLRVGFTASLGPLRVHGRFPALEGRLVLPAGDASGDVQDASIAVDVVATSVDTGLALRDRHLRGLSFLDAARYPTISFRSQQVRRAGDALLVAGVLTLCGVTREVEARATLSRRAPHAGLGEWPEVRPALGNGHADADVVIARAILDLPIRQFGVGAPRGRDVLNPIFLLVGQTVLVTLSLALPAARVPASWLSDRAR